MADKYLVPLTEAEQESLFTLLKKGKASARKVTRTHILLQAAEEATDEEIAEALRVGVSAVHRTRHRFVGSVPEGDIGGFNVLRILEIKNHRIYSVCT